MIPCVAEILTRTGGYNVTQLSLRAGMKAFFNDGDVDVDPHEQEKAAYSIRALISQMANHK
eukprot:5422649-Pyramimonas_sp.AAC.1